MKSKPAAQHKHSVRHNNELYLYRNIYIKKQPKNNNNKKKNTENKNN